MLCLVMWFRWGTTLYYGYGWIKPSAASQWVCFAARLVPKLCWSDCSAVCWPCFFQGSYCRVAIGHGCNAEIPWKIWFCWCFQASNWHHFAQYLVIKLSTWECPKIVDLPPINCHLYLYNYRYIVIHLKLYLCNFYKYNYTNLMIHI